MKRAVLPQSCAATEPLRLLPGLARRKRALQENLEGETNEDKYDSKGGTTRLFSIFTNALKRNSDRLLRLSVVVQRILGGKSAMRAPIFALWRSCNCAGGIPGATELAVRLR
jgi:hypothetical protein